MYLYVCIYRRDKKEYEKAQEFFGIKHNTRFMKRHKAYMNDVNENTIAPKQQMIEKTSELKGVEKDLPFQCS